MINVALLASRSGQNASWLIKAASTGQFPFVVSAIICNGSGACGRRFDEYSIPVVAINDSEFSNRGDFERKLLEILDEFDNPLAVSCSFNRLLGEQFLEAYPSSVINSHPSLLPAFPGRVDGLKPVDAAIHYGCRIAGATIHFIDRGMDTGPVIMQGALMCDPNKSSQKIISSVLRLEALLKIATLCYFGEDCVRWEKNSRRVEVDYESKCENDKVWDNMKMLVSPPPPPQYVSQILRLLS